MPRKDVLSGRLIIRNIMITEQRERSLSLQVWVWNPGMSNTLIYGGFLTIIASEPQEGGTL